MFHQVNNDWTPFLKEEAEKKYFQTLQQFVQEEYEHQTIYPAYEDIWNAFLLTPYHQVKAVIIGQDPYHGAGQAEGLSFSVRDGVKIPPSLRNIFKELREDMGFAPPRNGSLVKWAKEGVLLLNTVLTVREGQAHSHKGKGWEILTDHVIGHLNSRDEHIVFILWGKPAEKKATLIDETKHTISTSPHPSPLSARRGFFGSRPFSKVNEALQKHGQHPIDWRLEEHGWKSR
ncbi:uracil-DNA glycosylase [Bacillus coahuilensis p1.1.43]|uniref:Uracil-DNA glycosylase n=1 Tax=Bacillus coahuilensis p1.1.43 TaxID=1150625 RepID=A0A147K3V8_9BACI|nr:uracil-DNA glycosylase [Bacillus coahuilensis]KUP03975.1 uracil-DNA glycosylase [Bacillus coahuilensis p1.1.43]